MHARAATTALVAVSLAALLSGVPHAAAQPQYSAVWPTISPGTYSSALGVNSLGRIVGYYNVPNSQQAFLWSPADGLRTLAGNGSQAKGINDAGQIAGYKFDDVVNADNGQTYSRQHACWWTLETGLHGLGSGWPQNAAHAISAGGRLVGVSGTGSPVWAIDGGSVDMGLPSAAVAHAISPNGEIVVGGLDTGNVFMWTAAAGMQDLGAMGGLGAVARGVNDHGQIVGRVNIDSANAFAFSWTSAGGVRLINNLGHVWSEARAVNNAGVIVGTLLGTSIYGIPDMAFIEVDGVTHNLNNLVVSSAGPYLQYANAISNDGRIAGDAAGGGVFVLTPCTPTTLAGPTTISTCRSGSATFSVTAGGTGPFTYQWFRAPATIIPGETISVLTITNASAADAGAYYCTVTNACGSVTSDPATLAICFADLNCDDGVDINDLLYFLSSFEAGSFAIDLDNGTSTGTPDGAVDINDLLFFLAHFEAGC